MPFRFSNTSRDRLHTCHPHLQAILTRALGWGIVDLTIIEGHRSAEKQTDLVKRGLSKAQPWSSRHNVSPSLAVDVAPFIGGAIPWNDREPFVRMAGVLQASASVQGVAIRWGGDWDMDWSHRDQTFHDLPHFELVVSPEKFDRAVRETRATGSWVD
ncbi:MAG: M15 family metallopeptidase [Alphaproteobacteria bacterium]